MYCPNCGAENPSDKKFCGDCGGILSSSHSQSYVDTLARVRWGYLLGGGVTAAIFFGLFYWSTKFTYTERVWQDVGYGYGFWVTVTRTIDPSIQALLLVAAIIGIITMIYGVVSRK